MEYTAETEQKEREAAEAFAALYRIVARLRAPDGCPWDREQTPLSLRETMVEETYEAVEAVTEGDPAHVREELGDVLLNAVMAAYMYEEQGEFRVADTLTELAAKLVRRHPHVFGGEGYPGPQDAARAATADAVLSQWDAIKRDVEGRKTKGLLDGISAALPPLTRAQKIQKKADANPVVRLFLEFYSPCSTQLAVVAVLIFAGDAVVGGAGSASSSLSQCDRIIP